MRGREEERERKERGEGGEREIYLAQLILDNEMLANRGKNASITHVLFFGYSKTFQHF